MVALGAEPARTPQGFVAASPSDDDEVVIPERSKKMLPNMMMPDLVATFFAPVQGDLQTKLMSLVYRVTHLTFSLVPSNQNFVLV